MAIRQFKMTRVAHLLFLGNGTVPVLECLSWKSASMPQTPSLHCTGRQTEARKGKRKGVFGRLEFLFQGHSQEEQALSPKALTGLTSSLG